MYKRITYSDRLIIEKELKLKIPVSHIAKLLNKSRKSIYLEIRKGIVDIYGIKEYSCQKAQQVTDWNVSSRGTGLKIDKNINASKLIEKYILSGYSPYAVSQILKRKKIISLSKNTIYNYIYSGLFINISSNNLVSGRRKRSYSKVVRQHKKLFGKSIEHRPSEVISRITFGHWEMDTVQPKQGSKACFLVLTERKSRYELIAKLADKTALSVNKALLRLLKKHKGIFKTITCDNGPEFSNATALEKYGVQIYYCHPYTSSERGSNENQNRFIRRRYPKGISFDAVSPADVKDMQIFINTYPRALFNGLSSADVFEACNARA